MAERGSSFWCAANPRSRLAELIVREDDVGSIVDAEGAGNGPSVWAG